MELIAVGLISSLLTVAITKILDILQKKMEYKHALGKSFFERKLLIAEAAVSQRRILISCLQTFNLLVDQLVKNVPLILASPPDFLKQMNESNQRALNKLNNPSLEPGYAVSLFFDLGESQDTTAGKQMMDLFMIIDSRSKFLQFLNEQYMTAGNNDTLKAMITKAANESIAELRKALEQLNPMIEAGLSENSKIIALIRTEMKQYES